MTGIGAALVARYVVLWLGLVAIVAGAMTIRALLRRRRP